MRAVLDRSRGTARRRPEPVLQSPVSRLSYPLRSFLTHHHAPESRSDHSATATWGELDTN